MVSGVPQPGRRSGDNDDPDWPTRLRGLRIGEDWAATIAGLGLLLLVLLGVIGEHVIP